MLPKARTDKLTVREMANETLVYDLESNKAHCLNPTSAFIWRHCDGERTVAALAKIVEDKLQINNALAVVNLALEQLSRRNLLEKPLRPATPKARLARRDVLKKLVAAAVALPFVMTITAPKARAAGSQCTGQTCSPKVPLCPWGCKCVPDQGSLWSGKCKAS